MDTLPGFLLESSARLREGVRAALSAIPQARAAACAALMALSASGAHAADAYFPGNLLENTTGFAGSLFTGPPNGEAGTNGTDWVGIGGQIVTFDLGLVRIIDGTGGDFNLYEVDFGGAEFNSISVGISEDGAIFTLLGTPLPIVPVDNDPGHTSDVFARSYDIAGSGLSAVRYVRIDGNGTSAAGSTSGFDLDAMGTVNYTVVPLPASAALYLIGLAVLRAFVRRPRMA